MDKLHIRKEISALIDSIKEHSDNIKNQDQVPQLELELILTKIKKLYEKSIVFNHLNSIPDVIPAEEKRVVDQSQAAIAAEIKAEPLKPVDLFGAEVSPIADKVKLEKPVRQKEEKTSITSIQKPPVTDIKAAIGINDKFQFMNELFQGSVQEYEIAVQQLNTAGSLESAMDYIANIQQLYNWDLEHDSVKRLLDLVDRRYS